MREPGLSREAGSTDAGKRIKMIIQQLINGLMLGSTYSLVAIGYTLIFGVLGVLHFAHGEVLMAGAFMGLYIILWSGLPCTFPCPSP